MYGTVTISNSSTSFIRNDISDIYLTYGIGESNTYTRSHSLYETIYYDSQSDGVYYTSYRYDGYFNSSTLNGKSATFSGDIGVAIIESDEDISFTSSTTTTNYGTDAGYNNAVYQSLPFKSSGSILRYQELSYRTTIAEIPVVILPAFNTFFNSTTTAVLFTGEYTSTSVSRRTYPQVSSYSYYESTTLNGQSSSMLTSYTLAYGQAQTLRVTNSGTRQTLENYTESTKVSLTNSDSYLWGISNTSIDLSYYALNYVYTKSIITTIITNSGLWQNLVNTLNTTFIRHVQVDNSYFNVTYDWSPRWQSSIFLNIESSKLLTDTYTRECVDNNELNYISTYSLRSSDSLNTIVSFLKINNQYWTATSGISTATWKSITSTSSSTSSSINSNWTWPNGSIGSTTWGTVIKDNEFEFSSSTSIVSSTSRASLYNNTGLIDSTSEEISYSTTYNKSQDRFFSSATTYSSYWFGGAGILSESSTISVSSTYSSYSTHTIPLESTFTAYDIASTIDGEYYTYETTFYGTLEGIGISKNSWLNAAIKASGVFTSKSELPDAATFFTRTQVFSSFGNDYEYTTEESTISESSQTAKTLWNTREETSYITRSRTFKDEFLLVTEINEDTLFQYYLESYVSNVISTTMAGPIRDIILLTGTLSFTSSNSYLDYETSPEYSTALNTSEFGTTARISSLVSSKNWVNVFNTYLADNYAYTYDVSSIWNYSNAYETLSEYSTALATSFKKTYNTDMDYDSYSYTKSSSTNVLTITEDRFNIRNGITNYSTVDVNITNTIAIYNNSTMATVNSYTSSSVYSTSRRTSVIDYTFISSSADFTSSDSVVDTFTTSNVREQFNNSLSTVISSTMEQQNDTLVFKSEIATFSTYNMSTTYSTISTLEVNYEATTYTEEYNPISYTVSSTIQSTSLAAGTMLRSTSESVVYTQSVEYTPVYTTVDGIYVTTN